MNIVLWERVRRRVLVEGCSKRGVMREEGLAWATLQKMLSHSAPPGYRQRRPRPKRKLGEHWEWLESVLAGDRQLPRKQRHTAKRLWDRLRAERGFEGGYTVVKEAVRELRRRGREVFMPLAQRAGTMQMDFGQALARIGGELRKVHLAVFALPYSDAVYVRAYERECTETFWDGHVRAFGFFGGVPVEITYDNTRVAVVLAHGSFCHGKELPYASSGGGRERKLTSGFLQLSSHYLFGHRFCRVARPNEKGVVEGMVKYTRLNFMVPVPEAGTLEELNGQLEARCREDLRRRVRGREQTKEQMLAEDREAFGPLPPVAFEACRKAGRISNSLSLVRFDDNDYSVPVAHAHVTLTVKAGCEQVAIYRGPERVACHRRLWGKEQTAWEPVHYLALLERKPGSLDASRPLAGLELAPCFGVLRRRLENSHPDGQGTREYIRVLRLLERHPIASCANCSAATPSPAAKTSFSSATPAPVKPIWLRPSGSPPAWPASACGSPPPPPWPPNCSKPSTSAASSASTSNSPASTCSSSTNSALVPFSKPGAELLFDVVARAYERSSLIVTTNLPFENWTEVMGSERLTGALLDRLTHRVHILEANGESFRLADAKRRMPKP